MHVAPIHCGWTAPTCNRQHPRELPGIVLRLGIEPRTHDLRGRCSAAELPELGAGEGNRTPVLCLEGSSSTIELHPHEWSRRRSNPRPVPFQGTALPSELQLHVLLRRSARTRTSSPWLQTRHANPYTTLRSGWRDLNSRPSGPQPDALAVLSYSP